MSWERLMLREVLMQVKTPVQIHKGKEYKLVTISNTGDIKLRKIENGSQISAEKAFEAKKGAFIYSRLSVHNGAFGVVPDDLDGALITSEMPIFDINSNTLPNFLIYSLKLPSFKLQLNNLTKGMGRTRVKEENFLSLYINIPSLELQKIILDKITEKDIWLTHISQEFFKQLDLLKKLRQQILQDAVQGNLVPQDTNDEPASVLLERIKAEKEKLVREKKIKKEKPLPPISPEEIPFEIPENWVWCRLGEITYIASGSTPKQDAFINGTIPYLKMYNLRNQKIDFDYKPQFIKEEVHNGQLKRSRTQIGDVLMNIVGPPLGKLAIVPESLPQANFNQAAVLIRPHSQKEINEWIFWYLNEMSEIKSVVTKGVAGQDNISVTQSKNMKIALPPLQEQQRIVNKIEQLMTLCDELEQSIQQNQKYTQELLQVALKEALEPK